MDFASEGRVERCISTALHYAFCQNSAETNENSFKFGAVLLPLLSRCWFFSEPQAVGRWKVGTAPESVVVSSGTMTVSM